MFAVLCVHPKRGLFERKVKVEKKKICNTNYLKVTVAGKMHYDKIAKKLDGTDSILLPESMDVLSGFCGVKVFNATHFLQMMMRNTVLKILKTGEENANKMVVCVEDTNADYVDFVKELPAFAGTVKVMTACEDIYQSVSEEVMEQFGTALVLCETSGGYTLKIVPDKLTIFVGDEQTRLWFDRDCLELNYELCRQFPPGINRFDFFAALCQQGGYHRVCFEKIKTNNRVLKVEDFVLTGIFLS